MWTKVHVGWGQNPGGKVGGQGLARAGEKVGGQSGGDYIASELWRGLSEQQKLKRPTF
jgi:hypothetical protein